MSTRESQQNTEVDDENVFKLAYKTAINSQVR